MVRRKFVLSLFIFFSIGHFALSQAREIVLPSGVTSGDLPFSPGVRSGDLLHLAGTLGTDANDRLVAGGIEAQTRQALENLGAVLRAGAMDYRDVVSATVYLSDSRLFDEMNRVYRQFFQTRPPVRATVEADLVRPGALVEIALIAADPKLRREVIDPPGWAKNPLPYSRAIRVGDYLFLAGLVSQDPQTRRPVSGDIQTQTRRTLENARMLAQAAGFRMSEMVVSRVWLADPRDFQGMNNTYRGFFGDVPPTRATVRGRIMSADYKIEIMLTGLKGEREQLGTPGPSPYSPAIKIGDRIFVAGIVRASQELQGDIRGQTQAVLEQIRSLLEEGGMSMQDVVSSNVWLSDARNFDAMNAVYRLFFPQDPPARATVGADLMSPEGLIEIAVTAAR